MSKQVKKENNKNYNSNQTSVSAKKVEIDGYIKLLEALGCKKEDILNVSKKNNTNIKKVTRPFLDGMQTIQDKSSKASPNDLPPADNDTSLKTQK